MHVHTGSVDTDTHIHTYIHAYMNGQIEALKIENGEFKSAAEILGQEVDELRATLEATNRAADSAVKSVSHALYVSVCV